MKLKALLSPRTGVLNLLAGLPPVSITDATGAHLYGAPQPQPQDLYPVCFEGVERGQVAGSAGVAALLEYLMAKEAERRALAAEVLHLYREIHLIEQLSEQLATLLDLTAVGQAALDQARRLIVATSGAVLLRESPGGPLREVAAFGDPVSAWAGPIEIAGILADGVAAPLKATHRTVGVIALARPGIPYSSADLKLLNTIALQTAIAVEGALLAVEMVQAVRDREQLSALQKELDTARTIQHSLVPRVFPPFPERDDFEIHAQMNSAKAVGGDFFDFFLIDPEHLGVVIGDVSGKGIPAALYMAVTRTQIKTTALQGVSPAACLLEVNRGLVRDRVSSMFATCFYGILNTRTGDFRYCNAGHNPPYILRRDGQVDTVPMTGGMPLGMFSKLKCTEGSVTVGDKEALLLYTDGVPEATNAQLADFTDARLVASLSRAEGLTCREIVDHLMRALDAFTLEAPQSDDITVLALRRTG